MTDLPPQIWVDADYRVHHEPREDATPYVEIKQLQDTQRDLLKYRMLTQQLFERIDSLEVERKIRADLVDS